MAQGAGHTLSPVVQALAGTPPTDPVLERVSAVGTAAHSFLEDASRSGKLAPFLHCTGLTLAHMFLCLLILSSGCVSFSTRWTLCALSVGVCRVLPDSAHPFSPFWVPRGSIRVLWLPGPGTSPCSRLRGGLCTKEAGVLGPWWLQGASWGWLPRDRAFILRP